MIEPHTHIYPQPETWASKCIVCGTKRGITNEEEAQGLYGSANNYGLTPDTNKEQQPGQYRDMNNVVEIYEGDLKMLAHDAMEVLARKSGLKYVPGEQNEVYLDQIADALLTTLKANNSTYDIVVRKR